MHYHIILARQAAFFHHPSRQLNLVYSQTYRGRWRLSTSLWSSTAFSTKPYHILRDSLSPISGPTLTPPLSPSTTHNLRYLIYSASHHRKGTPERKQFPTLLPGFTKPTTYTAMHMQAKVSLCKPMVVNRFLIIYI